MVKTIEIIMHHVDMPPYSNRRFQKNSIDGKKWIVTDIETGNVVKLGSYEDCAIVCHNLNKSFYNANINQ